jgi:hypothetical protein
MIKFQCRNSAWMREVMRNPFSSGVEHMLAAGIPLFRHPCTSTHHMVGTYICRYMQGPCGAPEERMGKGDLIAWIPRLFATSLQKVRQIPQLLRLDTEVNIYTERLTLWCSSLHTTYVGRRAKNDCRATDGVGRSCRECPRVDCTDVKSRNLHGLAQPWDIGKVRPKSSPI